MITTIVKRDGRKEKFDPKKIAQAITKAFIEVDGQRTPLANAIIQGIVDEITNSKTHEIYFDC